MPSPRNRHIKGLRRSSLLLHVMLCVRYQDVIEFQAFEEQRSRDRSRYSGPTGHAQSLPNSFRRSDQALMSARGLNTGLDVAKSPAHHSPHMRKASTPSITSLGSIDRAAGSLRDKSSHGENNMMREALGRPMALAVIAIANANPPPAESPIRIKRSAELAVHRAAYTPCTKE
ncbi:MAG: hypothetical protein JWR17_3269 [Pseudomonas sp.]|nr:hypothetical protein [Pseudomonas sp.]